MKIIVRDNLGKDVTNDREWYINADGKIFYYTGDIDGPLYIVDNDYTFEVVNERHSENGGSNDGVLCPECGAVLEVMICHWYNTIDGHARNTIFHCNVCHNDWEKDEEYVAQPVKFTRKFWG